MSSMRNEACPCHFIQGLAPQLWKGGSRHIYKPLVKDFNCSEWVRLLDCWNYSNDRAISHRIQKSQISDEFLQAIVSSFGGYLGNGLAVTHLFTQLLDFKKGHPFNSYALLTDSVKLSEIVAEATQNLLIVNSGPVLNSNCIYKLIETVLS